MDVLYTASATSSGGRNGHVRSDDAVPDLALAMPNATRGNIDVAVQVA